MVYYPLNAGRNVDELLRLIDALQTSDREGVSCPATWTPGDDVVVGAPRTTDDLKKRLADDSLNLNRLVPSQEFAHVIERFGCRCPGRAITGAPARCVYAAGNTSRLHHDGSGSVTMPEWGW